MSTPRPLNDLLDLLADLQAGRPELTAGPTRVELPGEELSRNLALQPELGRLLPRASFLGVTWAGRPQPADLECAAQLAETHELFLDLRLDLEHAGLPQPLPGVPRLARMVLEAGNPADILASQAQEHLAALLDALSGSLVLRLTLDLPGLAQMTQLVSALASLPAPLLLHLVARDAEVHEQLLRERDNLRAMAQAQSLNLSASGVGRWPAGPPADHLLAWNVLHTLLRQTFFQRPSICPFPFIMLRPVDGQNWHLCPQTGGPLADPDADGQIWNGAAARAVREAFQQGKLPLACRSCSLFPRVLSSLQE